MRKCAYTQGTKLVDTVHEEVQILHLLHKLFKSVILNAFKELKKPMYKEL